jgi:molybdate/tungstate transport system substrate-binding protein
MKRGLSTRNAAVLIALCGGLLFVSCANRSQNRTVSVLYAGSLATVMENGLGTAFSKSSGYEFQGEAQGSLGAARMIHDHLRSPDVFISADPSVNEKVLMGSKNGDMVTWFLTLASSQLVLAYSPNSKFAEKFKEAAAGTVPWYEVLKTPGLRFGRGDPRTDPKGYRTLFLFELAGKHYQRPELPGLLGDPINPEQVFPEVALLARVQSGQSDAGIFYKHEVVAHKLPFVTFPPEINLSDPKFSALYAQASYTTPSGEHVSGAPILFTITIPKTVGHKESALAFVRFLLSSNDLLKEFGFGTVDHRVGGDVAQVPSELSAFSSGKFEP